jgi:uncharacterized membrane protein
VLAGLLVLPAALVPRAHDSFWIDWVWADQFTAELRRGNLYPRWLPRSHAGLGSPVFYYYPPLAFYVSGFFGLAGLSTYASVVGAFALGFAASGAAMYHWLKGWTHLPLVGSLFYMAAPYHLFDFYARGALAEFVAIGFIPLVALGMKRIAEGRGYLVLSLGYAGLIATHLPLALLASVFLVAPYAMKLGLRHPRKLAILGLALALGLALVAIYLVPALTMRHHRDEDALWALQVFKPEHFSFIPLFRPGALDPGLLLVALLIIGLITTIWFLLRTQRSGWAYYAGFCCILTMGVVPWLWSLPLLESVQFPYRVLPLVEFGIGTAVALVPQLCSRVALILLPSLAVSTSLIAAPPPEEAAEQLSKLKTHYPDVSENLPPGDRPYSFPSQWALDIAASHQVAKQVGNRTIEPVFYFPSWKILCAGHSVRTFPDAATGLLSYRGSGCSRQLSWTAAEKAGALTSGGAVLAILMVAGLRRRRRHPDQ